MRGAPIYWHSRGMSDIENSGPGSKMAWKKKDQTTFLYGYSFKEKVIYI
jgi:hypothetical protein